VIDAVYRAESRPVPGTLIRLLGRLELAEKAPHEASAAAVERPAESRNQLSRRAFLSLTAAGLLKRPWAQAGASPAGVVEDWSAETAGATGVPVGWRRYETPLGRAAYDFTIVNDGGRRALDLKSAGDHSTIAKEIHVSLAATPLLGWQWKILSFPHGADLRKRAASDATGHLFVVWPRFPALLRSHLIGYVWDPTLPIGSILPSRKTRTVTFIVVRSGDQALGQWLDERRDVVQDYRMLFGETPARPQAIALSIDTNDTHTTAEGLFGRIAFTAP
jgi:Protein of unknown function (DUF3047)